MMPPHADDSDISTLPIFAAPPPAWSGPSLAGGRSTGHGVPEPAVSPDWSQVRAFRQQAAARLAAQLRDEGTDEQRRATGRQIINDILDEHVRRSVAGGATALPVDDQAVMAQLVFDALFGLGRLQPLVDDPSVENIEVYGTDPVVIIDGDGHITRRPPIVDSDAELIDLLSFLASRGGASERSFSTAHPSLHLNLSGGHRLAASGWTTHRPVVVIRRHRFVDVDLADLVGRETMTPAAAQFLRAAVLARKSIVVSGAMGSGKTTLVRALANEIHPDEKLGTIETEYELGLHTMHHRHRRIVAWEARPGSGERDASGRAVGEITLDDLVYDALRMNLDRLIVGEVRGREVLPMFKAMQTGAGSLSTVHAHSARAAIERLVTCAMEAGPHVTADFAYRQVAQHINLIVHIERHRAQRDGQATQQRRIAEILAIEPGELGMPATTSVFALDADSRMRSGAVPAWIHDLTAYDGGPGRLSSAVEPRC